MSFFKKLFGKEKKEENPNNIELPWINPSDNPWGLRLLDLRSFTQNRLSTSTDPTMAANAVSYGGDDGTVFFGVKPKSSKKTQANISLPVDKVLITLLS